jgi:hypothetical protein
MSAREMAERGAEMSLDDHESVREVPETAIGAARPSMLRTLACSFAR